MRFLDPKNDVAFKKIFGDKRHTNVLISFLNSVLDLRSPIKEIVFLSKDQLPEIEMLKETSLDVKAKDEQNREFIIEMQVEKQLHFHNRSLYYAAKSYAHQIYQSDDYSKLTPVIFLGILDFSLFQGEDFLINHYFINQQSGNRDISDMELNFIELPKFTKTEEKCVSLADKWIFFLKNANHITIEPKTLESQELKTAYHALEKYYWRKSDLDLYEARARFMAAKKDSIETALQEGLQKGLEQGLQKGLEQGLQQGIEQGLQKGLQQGIEQGIQQSISKLIASGMTEEQARKILL